MEKRVPGAMALALAFTLVSSAPLTAAGRSNAEASPREQTEGFTAAEHLQAQADLSRWLGSERRSAGPIETIRVAPSREALDSLESAAAASGTPLRIGLVEAMTPAVIIDGVALTELQGASRRAGSARSSPTPDGGEIWTVAVAVEEAGAVRLHIEEMSLPGNAALYVYNDGGEAAGPYTGTGPDGSGEFWTTALFGDQVYLQLRLTAPVTDADRRAVALRLLEAGLISRRFTDGLRRNPAAGPPPPGPCGTATCLVDASCVTGTPADDAKNAVAKMEWVQGAYIYTCTGGLIADNNPSQANYFLTANHCVSKANTAKNVDFYWRFATTSCGGTCPDNSGWPYRTTGAAVRVTGRKGDFSLLQLNSAPPAGSVFLGWSTAAVASTNGAHLYRISNPDFNTQVYTQEDVDTSAGTCSGWPRGERIYSRDIVGAIDGGSSGSPIVNASSQIVGQLSGTCGSNPSQVCSSGPGEANATVDGAFAFYYASVQPFLNP